MQNISPTPTLFHKLIPSRKKHSAGDVFVVKLDEGYLFGLVLSGEATMGYGDNFRMNLLCFFRGFYDTPSLDNFPAAKDRILLMSHKFTNNLGWARGWFETVGHIELAEADIPSYSFRWSGDENVYYDENGKVLPGPVGTVGYMLVGSYLTIEDDIARALGKAPTIV